MVNIPRNKKLYAEVKKLADELFLSKTGIYKSSWIVREYLKRGGTYYGVKNQNTRLARWYKEKWVDLTRPLKNGNGYEKCGRKKAILNGIYPFCRPTIKVNKKTPKTWKEMTQKSIEKIIEQKQKIKKDGYVKVTKK